jgi:hypothetical protein
MAAVVVLLLLLQEPGEAEAIFCLPLPKQHRLPYKEPAEDALDCRRDLPELRCLHLAYDLYKPA